jgi:hypothetical protein
MCVLGLSCTIAFAANKALSNDFAETPNSHSDTSSNTTDPRHWQPEFPTSAASESSTGDPGAQQCAADLDHADIDFYSLQWNGDLQQLREMYAAVCRSN